MEEKGGIYEVARVGDDTESIETLCERYFTVGEVVEYWEGVYVRGERLGSGEPAFVKRVEGKGVYAIKMVGPSRGKFRLVGWESLFKNESFNKNVARVDVPRWKLLCIYLCLCVFVFVPLCLCLCLSF